MPDFPTPVVTTLPEHLSRRSIAATKVISSRAAAPRIAIASTSSVSCANSIQSILPSLSQRESCFHSTLSGKAGFEAGARKKPFERDHASLILLTRSCRKGENPLAIERGRVQGARGFQTDARAHRGKTGEFGKVSPLPE